MPTSITKETKVSTSVTKETKPSILGGSASFDTYPGSFESSDTDTFATATDFAKELKPTTSITKESKP